MRILIPVPEKHIQDKNDNPFIKVLFNGLLDKGFDVIYGIDIFWHSIEYNCVFFNGLKQVIFLLLLNSCLIQ